MTTLAAMVQARLNKKPKSKKSGVKHMIMTIPNKPKANKQKRSHKESMGKRKGKSKGSSHKSGFSGIKGQLGGIVKKVSPYALALGTGSIAVLALSKFKPDASMQTAQLVGAGAAYMAAGFEGLIGSEIIKAIAGAPSLLSGLVGGGGGMSNQAQNSNGWL